MHNRSKEFSEKLILAVKEERSLYDLSDSQYKNVQKKEVIWRRIGDRLNTSSEDCKKRWKSLRDTYKKKKLAILLPSASQAPDPEKWKYFSQMSFLDSAQSCRKTLGNLQQDDSESYSRPNTESGNELKFSFCNTSGRKRRRDVDSKFLEFLAKAEQQLEERNATSQIFLSLARKINEAHLGADELDEIEMEVASLVYDKLNKFRNNSI